MSESISRDLESSVEFGHLSNCCVETKEIVFYICEKKVRK